MNAAASPMRRPNRWFIGSDWTPWAETARDLRHLENIAAQVPVHGIVAVELKDGRTAQGYVCRWVQGNNLVRGGFHYYGELRIVTRDGSIQALDYQDIVRIRDITQGDFAS